MRLVGTVIRSRNVGRQMAVVGTWMEVRRLAFPVSVSFHSRSIFTPQSVRAPGYCRRPSGRAGGRAEGQTSPVNTPTSPIFHGSFSNLARTFITLRSGTSSIMEVLPH